MQSANLYCTLQYNAVDLDGDTSGIVLQSSHGCVNQNDSDTHVL